MYRTNRSFGMRFHSLYSMHAKGYNADIDDLNTKLRKSPSWKTICSILCDVELYVCQSTDPILKKLIFARKVSDIIIMLMPQILKIKDEKQYVDSFKILCNERGKKAIRVIYTVFNNINLWIINNRDDTPMIE